MDDEQFDTIVNELTNPQLDALKKYIIDGFVPKNELIKLSKKDLLDIAGFLADKNLQRSIDCGELKINRTDNMLKLAAFCRVIKNPDIESAISNGFISFRAIASAQDIQKLDRILAMDGMSNCIYRCALSLKDLKEATEEGARTLRQIYQLAGSVIIPKRILKLTQNEAKILSDTRMLNLLFPEPHITIEQVLALSDIAKKVLCRCSLVLSHMFSDPAPKSVCHFFDEFSEATEAGMAALSNPKLEEVLKEKISSGALTLQRIFRFNDNDVACLADNLDDDGFIVMFNEEEEEEEEPKENCIIS